MNIVARTDGENYGGPWHRVTNTMPYTTEYEITIKREITEMGEMDFTKLGLMIKYERRRLHLTQEELAKDIGMTKAVLGQVERGERTITVERLIKLANRLGVSVDYLLNDYTHNEDSQIIREFRAMIHGQPIERKRMAMDTLRPIFYYFENNDDKK